MSQLVRTKNKSSKITKFLITFLWVLGINIGVKTSVIWWISWLAHTNIKVVVSRLANTSDGINTNIDLLSSANHMWYWQIKSSKEIRPIHENKYE